MDLWQRLRAADKPIVLYGMGDGADKILGITDSLGIKVSGVFVSDGFVRPKLFHGMPLMSYSDAKAQFGDMIVLMAFGSGLAEVLNNVKRIWGEQEFYVPDVPVAGGGVFDTAFAVAHRQELEEVYNALATDEDRRVFKTLVEYKLSGMPTGLYTTAKDERALYTILAPKNGEVYVDCGAFTGDTVAAYLKWAKGYEKIYAVEPDKRSFKKLLANTAGLDNIECINAPLSSTETVALFSPKGSRGSKLAEAGEAVQAVTVDGILNGRRADYIKIDVEGAESDLIVGAINTINTHRPKLLVSCYHRVEDIFALPLQILSIRNDYKLHLWHPMCLPPWDASFIFV